MSISRSAWRTAGALVGAAGVTAAAAYGAQRTIMGDLRRRPDPDAGSLGPLEVDEIKQFPAHDGGVLTAFIRGEGPTVVLSHGVTIDSRVWTKQFVSLPKAGLRVVAFDHRGHGQSMVGETGYSLNNLGCDLRTVLEELDIHDAVLVGHSMGGVGVQEFAIHQTDALKKRVRGLVLLSTFSQVPAIAPVFSSRFPSSMSLSHLMRRPNLGTVIARAGFGREPKASHVELTRLMVAECDERTAREASLPLAHVNFISDLSKLNIPTLVINGTADLLTPLSGAQRTADAIDGANLEILNGAGHMIMLERSQTFDELVQEFVRSVGLTPRVSAG